MKRITLSFVILIAFCGQLLAAMCNCPSENESCRLDCNYPVSCWCGGATIMPECISDSSCSHLSTFWTYYSEGYETRMRGECDSRLGCMSQILFRCASGYYGSSKAGTTGCNLCPSGGTSNAGATDVTDCYASPDTGGDGSGDWVYEDKCYYSSAD
ncbi:MAG: hypothetical protein LBF28_03395 [Rickettsiales bacterium]|jgi:hypothetical protein|nr:hypothetical protein [Rickettsiales bacterium]